MEDAAARLINIFTSSFFSFLNAGVYLFEFFLALKFVELLKTDSFLKKATPWSRFILALIVTALAFPGLNGYITKYLGGLLGQGAPLAKIFLSFEAIFFGAVLFYLYRRRAAAAGEERGKK